MEVLLVLIIGIAAYTAVQRLVQHNSLVAQKAIRDQQYGQLSAANGVKECAPEQLVKFLTQYFREVSFGAEGSGWRMRNIDPDEGRFVCDFVDSEEFTEYVPAPINSVTLSRSHTEVTAGDIYLPQTTIVHSYTRLTICFQPLAPGFTKLSLDWEFRYPNKDAGEPIPSSLWRVCLHFISALAHKFSKVSGVHEEKIASFGREFIRLHDEIGEIASRDDCEFADSRLDIMLIVEQVELLLDKLLMFCRRNNEAIENVRLSAKKFRSKFNNNPDRVSLEALKREIEQQQADLLVKSGEGKLDIANQQAKKLSETLGAVKAHLDKQKNERI